MLSILVIASNDEDHDRSAIGEYENYEGDDKQYSIKVWILEKAGNVYLNNE